MNAFFLDTSFLLALVLKDDAHHERALAWQSYIHGQLLTTDYILIEFADALHANETFRRIAIATIELLQADHNTLVQPASQDLLNEGLQLFGNRLDKKWSLTDCISFVAMKRQDVTSALTSDHHFEQAGYDALLRRDPVD